MKKHAIIPIFIPHRGCPHRCVFCNQKIITARQPEVTPEDAKKIIEAHLPTLRNRGLKTVEIAFFGGSFTGLPLEEQSAFLSLARSYKERGLIHKIHLSTRPDYIDDTILDNLQRYSADVIELGVQSFDSAVLEAAGRGHTAEDVYRACRLIGDRGFTLGIQLMIGLPRDAHEKCLFSAEETARLAPSIARLYPTVLLPDTALYRMYLQGRYRPLSTEEAVSTTRDMYRILDRAGINIIRVGLKSTDLISEDGQTCGHTFHPAFRQLVEGAIAREDLQTQLKALLTKGARGPFAFRSSQRSFSNLVGHGGENRAFFAKAYPDLTIRYEMEKGLADGRYIVIEC